MVRTDLHIKHRIENGKQHFYDGVVCLLLSMFYFHTTPSAAFLFLLTLECHVSSPLCSPALHMVRIHFLRLVAREGEPQCESASAQIVYKHNPALNSIYYMQCTHVSITHHSPQSTQILISNCTLTEVPQLLQIFLFHDFRKSELPRPPVYPFGGAKHLSRWFRGTTD